MGDTRAAVIKVAKDRRRFRARKAPYRPDPIEVQELQKRLAGSTSFVLVDPEGRRYPARFGPPEGGWSKLPPVPAFHRKRPAQPLRKTPYTAGPRDPLEVLARLAGGTTFKTPTVGRSTRGQSIGTDDIAHALGHVQEPLCQRMAMAIACQSVAEWPQVQELAYPVLVRMLTGNHNTRALVTGWRRHRVRLVLYDVFHDLVLMRAPVWSEAAKRVRMRRGDYVGLHEAIAGALESYAQTGAYVACRVLFGGE